MSPFKMLGGAAAAIGSMFSPARLFVAENTENEQPEPEKATAPTASEPTLDDKTARRVQMTKAFTQLRTNLNESPAKAASPARKSPARKGKSPARKASGGVRGKQIAKVKSEPMRRSRRSKAYKKGQLSESTMAKLAWSGAGSQRDPIVMR